MCLQNSSKAFGIFGKDQLNHGKLMSLDSALKCKNIFKMFKIYMKTLEVIYENRSIQQY